MAYYAYPDAQGDNGPGYEIYVSPTDGSGPAIDVSNNPGDDWWPVWSPDGTRIAFVSSAPGGSFVPGGLHVVNADGTGQIDLTPADNVAEPAWSPDGTRIAYSGSVRARLRRQRRRQRPHRHHPELGQLAADLDGAVASCCLPWKRKVSLRPSLRWLPLTATFILPACRDDSVPLEPRAPVAAAVATYIVRDLGTLGGPSSRASDVNNAGVVVGQSATPTGATHAVRWQNGVMTDLGTLSGGTNSYAAAISKLGVIVGWSETGSGAIRAVRWKDGARRNLGTLGGNESHATDINDSGWIVGHSLTPTGETHAFLWRNGVMTDLGTLGGTLSIATGINSAGVIVGYSTKTASSIDKQYPFRWKDGVMRELPSLPGVASGNYARPAAIMAGRIVG